MSRLATITGPIAAGKNTVAALLAESLVRKGYTVVIADVDDVAAMVAEPGAAATGLWFAAHGALVARWMLSGVDVVSSIGPIYTQADQHAPFDPLPSGARPWRVLIDAPLSVTWQRANAEEGRGLSRQRGFHEAAHARFRSLIPPYRPTSSSTPAEPALMTSLRRSCRRSRPSASSKGLIPASWCSTESPTP